MLFPPKPVLVFEVFLPKKSEYLGKLNEVLDAFLDPVKLKSVPDIRKAITIGKTGSGFEEERFLRDISEIISGYSIYEADGRFCGTGGPIDERVLIIRFLIHDPLVEQGMRENLVENSKEVIRYLITKRFAEEIGVEDEIWFVEYRNCLLQRWVKTKA